MLARDGNSLAVDISQVVLTIKDLRQSQETKVAWPVIKLSAWVKLGLERGGEMMLGGHTISNESGWRALLRTFWSRYKLVDDSHPLFNSKLDPEVVLPFYLHGDEGRGRVKKPLLTISFQMVLSHYGPHRLNSSGSRLKR